MIWGIFWWNRHKTTEKVYNNWMLCMFKNVCQIKWVLLSNRLIHDRFIFSECLHRVSVRVSSTPVCPNEGIFPQVRQSSSLWSHTPKTVSAHFLLPISYGIIKLLQTALSLRTRWSSFIPTFLKTKLSGNITTISRTEVSNKRWLFQTYFLAKNK